jgi:hypothetical protein
MKPLAMIQVINALGLDRDVLRALPYTTMEFDNPALSNMSDKAGVADGLTKSYFNLVSGRMSMQQAISIISRIGGTDFPVDAKLMEEMRKRQERADAFEEEEHKLNMRLLEAQIEQAKSPPAPGFGASAPKGRPGGSGYSRLEQREHERSRGTAARMEGVQKAQAKKI